MRPLALFAFVATVAAAQPAAPPAILFRHVRVFDGARLLGERDVLVRGDRIAAIGASLAAPAGATVIDGAGKTLLPGLIDSHVHAWADAPATALAFGVTTELDMFTDHRQAAQWRAEQRAAGGVATRADVYSAGTLVTAAKGHGTEYGMSIPTIGSPDSAQAFVDARIAEGSDYIKIVFDDGRSYGRPTPTVSEATMRAVIAAAHRRGKLAVVHVHDLASARAAIGAGADGLAHLFFDRDPDADFGRFAASQRAFVIPTLTVLQSVSGVPSGASLVADARLARYIAPAESTVLAQGFPRRPNGPPVRYAAAESTVRQLKASGVPILTGTDAGNPGTGHGASIHRELELLVQAGLTPAEALAAATSAPARAFRLTDRGRIAAGLRADLVLVTGDPTRDVTSTRDVVGVWKGGVAVDRAARVRAVAAMREAATRAPAGAESGLVSDFESGEAKAAYGAGWSVSTDAVAGGQSSAQLAVADGGARGSGKSLGITGTIAAGATPWAGAMFSPGAQPFAPANLSTKKEIRFWAKGDGKTYRVLVFAQSKGYAPLMQTFVAGDQWAEHVFPIAAFGGIDGRDVMALIFAGGPAPGAFALRIDDLRIQ